MAKVVVFRRTNGLFDKWIIIHMYSSYNENDKLKGKTAKKIQRGKQ